MLYSLRPQKYFLAYFQDYRRFPFFTIFIYNLTIVKSMKETMPQDIEVRYILPAIRRELTNAFIEKHKLNQKEAAKLLGMTEAAISQYRHSKRAKEVVFSDEVLNQIRA